MNLFFLRIETVSQTIDWKAFFNMIFTIPILKQLSEKRWKS